MGKNVFEKSAEAIIDANVEAYLIQKGISPQNVPPHLLASSRQGVARNFALRMDFNGKIFRTLRKVLKGEHELLDMFAGDGMATLPLVKSGVIQKLFMLDDNTSPVSNAARTLAAQKMGIEDKVFSLAVRINADTKPDLIEKTPAVTLIATGLAMPFENRYINDGDTDPRAFRVPHIISDVRTVTFGDVLKALEGTPRCVHVFDAPFYKRPLPANGMRDYVQGILDGRPTWSIQQWSPITPEHPLEYGILVHK